MTKLLIVGADLDRTDTWIKYERTMCSSCVSSCCTMPVEVRFNDLLRLGLVQEFEREEPRKNIAKRLQKEGIVERFHQKSEIFTLVRMGNNDCLYLDRKTRLCTVYDLRPDDLGQEIRLGQRHLIGQRLRLFVQPLGR